VCLNGCVAHELARFGVEAAIVRAEFARRIGLDDLLAISAR
jgi:hypothetical protein